MAAKTCIRATAIMIVGTIAQSAFSSDCKDKIATFLSSPSKMTYEQVSGSGASSANCWPVIEYSAANREKISALVKAGDPWAIRFTAINIKTLDGGDLEDALAILGLASRSAPEFLLSLAAEGTISEHELASAAALLPPGFVEKPNEIAKELRERMDCFKSVKNEGLSPQRIYVVNELLKQVQELEATPKNR